MPDFPESYGVTYSLLKRFIAYTCGDKSYNYSDKLGVFHLVTKVFQLTEIQQNEIRKRITSKLWPNPETSADIVCQFLLEEEYFND